MRIKTLRQGMASSKKVRKVRIYLKWRRNLYAFCWMEMLTNGSLSFGFTSKTTRLAEYGTCIVRSGIFNEHAQLLGSGTLDIKGAESPHVTFHPPWIEQRSGIAQITASNGRVGRWELDWFPVRKPQLLLAAYTGEIALLDIAELKNHYEVVKVPPNLHCLRMEVVLYHLPTKSTIRLDDPNAIAHIMGGCPKYIVSCNFYENPVAELAFYVATDHYRSDRRRNGTTREH